MQTPHVPQVAGAAALPPCIVTERADYSLADWPAKRAREPDDLQRRAVLAMVVKALASLHRQACLGLDMRACVNDYCAIELQSTSTAAPCTAIVNVTMTTVERAFQHFGVCKT